MKALFEKRGKLAAEIKALADKIAAEKREFTAEEKASWDKANTEYDKTVSEIQVQERAKSISGHQPEPVATSEQISEKRALAFRGWAGGTSDKVGLGEREIQAARELGILGRNEIRIDIGRKAPATRAEARALSVVTGSAGAYTIPEGFVRDLETALLYFGPMREFSTILRTASGETMPYPTMNDTGNTGEQVGEGSAVTEADPTFGAVNMSSYPLSSKMVKVPFALLRDSAFDLSAFLGAALGERLGRIINTKATTGNGSSTFNGIVTASTLGVTAASASAITTDELIDLEHSVDLAYRKMPGAAWLMNDSTKKVLRKLKDSDNQYIWKPGLDAAPDTLLGYAVGINNDCAAIAASAKVILFGDIKKYLIREVGTIRLKRLEERYAEYDQVAFVAFLDADGDLINAGTNPVKYLQMHS